MIQPAEVRLKNWVEYKGKQYQISAMSETYPSVDSEEFGIGIIGWKDLKGIPLTPEVLEACGFDSNFLDENCNYYTHELNGDFHCNLSIIEGDKNGYCEACLFPYEDWFRWRYLHQLQNAIFALTGEELTYQPKTVKS